MITREQLTPEFLKSEEYKSLPLVERQRIGGMIGGANKKGYRFPKTVTKELVQKRMDSLIDKKAEKLIHAAMSLSLGQNFVYRIDVITKKSVLVTDEHEIETALNEISHGGVTEDGQYYFVTTKEPDIKAIDSLLNRRFGKAKETVDVNTNVTFSLRDLAQRRIALKDVNSDTKIIDVPIIDNQKT